MEINLGNSTNNSGGTLGGITTGEDVYFKVAIKPVSTIGKNQCTYDYDSNKKILEAKGRHDPCVLPRAMPIIEAMAAIVTGDNCLMQAARKCADDLMINKDNKDNENDNDNNYEFENDYGI
jgi:chorismate synthase